MIAEIKSSVFAHNFDCTNSAVNLEVINSKDRLKLATEKVGRPIRYELSVTDPTSLGLLNSEQNTLELFTKDLVLAINLCLSRAALSRRDGNLIQSHIAYKQTKQANTIVTRAVFDATTIFTEKIDEETVISNLLLINKVNRHNLSACSKKQLITLSKALSEYENAMSTFDRLAAFKNLFNSLELATNGDGKDRMGPSLDTEAAKITKTTESEIEDWRRFYDRTKHIDRTPNDITKFVKGMESLPEKLMPLRLASEKAIMNRLKKL
ncbi:MAG TPA: hypothetical protein VGB11_05080 [Candidatus Bathyarchaeia archaeon]